MKNYLNLKTLISEKRIIPITDLTRVNILYGCRYRYTIIYIEGQKKVINSDFRELNKICIPEMNVVVLYLIKIA